MPLSSPSLSISLVTFAPNMKLLADVVARLLMALRRLPARGEADAQLFVVDNGPGAGCSAELQELLRRHWDQVRFPCSLITGHGNVGYGRGHNKAIARACADYHLILNPDVLVDEDAISNALDFMERQPEVGLLAPAVVADHGGPQHLCKDYPSVLDLVLRGFAPAPLRAIVDRRLARYEIRQLDPARMQRGVPLVSGSFMFFRRRILDLTGGFADDYFLYFEDFDLSLRAAKFATVAYVPTVRIEHMGGHAAKKGIKHWWLFGRSAVTFFSQHGWRWY